MHDGFDYWVADLDDEDGSMAAALQQANEAAAPTDASDRRRGGVLDLGRQPRVPPLGAARRRGPRARRVSRGCTSPTTERLVEDDRLIGMFRAHGLVVPVWDLPLGTGAEALEEPAARVSRRARARRWLDRAR